MASTTPLTGSSNPIVVGQGYTLTAPGLQGSVEKIEKGQKSTRAAGVVLPKNALAFLADKDALLLAQFDVAITKDEHWNATDNVTRAGGLKAKTAEGEPAIILKTPKRRAFDSAVLLTDENGVSRWIWPEAGVQDEQSNHFYLPREGKALPETGERATRGPITKAIRSVVNVIGWATDEIVKLTAIPYIKSWEEKHRPYGLLAVEPKKELKNAVAWDKITGGRALLLLHGTFSTGQDAFYGLIQSDNMQKLYDHYQGRVFAFNHPTLHHTPSDNIRQFLQMLPKEVKNLELDLITHSRGGLVGRELCERLNTFNDTGRSIKVRRAIFVAGPHNGTILTNRDNVTKFIDAYTNLLTSLPDNPATIIMEALISVVKLVGGGTVHNLPGLQSMLPGGEWLKGLNAAPRPATEYYALAAQYMPTDEKLLLKLAKRALMKALSNVFGEDSDLVVPTRGCYETNPAAAGFPIAAERHIVYDAAADINHINFFEKPAVNEQLVRWLTV